MYSPRLQACLLIFTLALAGCSNVATRTAPAQNATRVVTRPTPLPTRVVAATTSINADGALSMTVPVATLGFAVSAPVTAVNVKLGQAVKKGDVLATVDDTSLQDAVVDAQLALSLTQVNIALTNASATTETIAAAQAALNSAYANYNVIKSGNTASAIEAARLSMDSAWKQYLSSQSSRDYACGGRNGLEKPGCKSAEASYGNTFESWVSARDNYLKLQEPVTQDTLTQAWASVVSAQTKLDALKAGVTNEQANVDTAQIDQAKAALQLAQNNLSKAKLVSPCDCIVQEIGVAVGVLPPGTAFGLVDLTHIQFTTANLVENDVAKIKIGAPVSIRLTAYPDAFSGKVSAILAQSSGTQNGAALYTVLIDLDPATVPLLPGMTGQAAITTVP